ncbi:hypothetical protein [Lacipirellula sp.]|uniref:hypothetical protein n=1 Tax=Lacipirellula sp. TaxID=2691419 RepID=UPI003D0A8335
MQTPPQHATQLSISEAMTSQTPAHDSTDSPLRFPLRAIGIATTLLAIGAAAAAPYWREQSPSVQVALLLNWSTMLLFGACTTVYHWRRLERIPSEAGAIAYTVTAIGRSKWIPSGNRAGLVFALLLIVVAVVLQSLTVVRTGRWASTYLLMAHAVFNGLFIGFVLGGAMRLLLQRPVYLCDKSIAGAIYSPWKFIRSANWISDRPGVMRLKQMGGDIYIDVREEQHEAVEAFVRIKTKFIDTAAASESQSTP